MKKLPIMLLLIVSTTVFAKVNNERGYQIKSAFIKYEITGFDHGFSEVYFDNYGDEESIYSETSLKVNDSEMKTMIGTIKVSNTLFTLNFMSRTYFTEAINKVKAKITVKRKKLKTLEDKVDDAFGELDSEMEKLETPEDKKKQLIGKEMVLDRECEVLRVNDGVVWVYKGIVLRKIQFLNKDKIIYEAVIFKENPKISKNVFEVPEGFMVVENPMNRLYESSN